MSLSLRVSWIVVVAALMLLAVLGSARAQTQAAPHCMALAMAHAVDVQANR